VAALGAVCTALTAVVEEAGVDSAPSRLDAGCEDDEAWLGVDRVGGTRPWLLECAGEGGSFFFFSFLDNLLSKEWEVVDMFRVVQYDAQIVS
jgi:hypothetical protein